MVFYYVSLLQSYMNTLKIWLDINIFSTKLSLSQRQPFNYVVNVTQTLFSQR